MFFVSTFYSFVFNTINILSFAFILPEVQ